MYPTFFMFLLQDLVQLGAPVLLHDLVQFGATVLLRWQNCTSSDALIAMVVAVR